MCIEIRRHSVTISWNSPEVTKLGKLNFVYLGGGKQEHLHDEKIARKKYGNYGEKSSPIRMTLLGVQDLLWPDPTQPDPIRPGPWDVEGPPDRAHVWGHDPWRALKYNNHSLNSLNSPATQQPLASLHQAWKLTPIIREGPCRNCRPASLVQDQSVHTHVTCR